MNVHLAKESRIPSQLQMEDWVRKLSSTSEKKRFHSSRLEMSTAPRTVRTRCGFGIFCPVRTAPRGLLILVSAAYRVEI